MHAVYAESPQPDDAMAGLVVGERPEPEVPDGWTRVRVQAASLNHHDLWTLRGVGLAADRFPMILGCDGAGVTDDGRDVVIYPVITSAAGRDAAPDETMATDRSLLTERYPGAMADYVAVPDRNVIARPAELTAAQAAVLGTTYLTAYRMLVTRSGLPAGSTILVQGATGGVSTALVQLGRQLGYRVWVTSRSPEGRDRAADLGAHQVFGYGERLPARVDGVMESVGEATWAHTLRSVRPGGVVVCCGATSGPAPSADLAHVFFRQVSVIGSTMGTRAEFVRLLDLMVTTGLRPVVDRSYPLADAREAFAALERGSAGKLVLTP